ncbi:hypothetical protein LSUB1_G004048 [Lachnellula subtilissima]|uniref:Small secreted protein n=1 Tax=Lachnellula subtilissima TaxID=602034 RepID=A0A8H8UAB9_9HELO|nr:hypothetical protein LSUB1_G004048 [Lachnellula subtilissima]
MHFSAPLAIFLSLTGALAQPTKRAAATSKAVLTVQTYNDFSVSSGVAGNALAEVNAKFPIDQTNFAGVAASDLAIISSAAQLSEQAETATGGFNTAVAAASGTAATALQNGKIKNKVLKLQTDVMRIQIEVAQGNTAAGSQLAAQQTKLATNVALDKAAAGQAATAISFAGSD